MWQGILGHDDVVEQFRRTLSSGRLASTYLFVGPAGIGKRRFAMELAHSLLCIESPDESLEPCGRCESCRSFAVGNHPDLNMVGLRPDKSELAISQFVGYDEYLNQEALCHRIALKPFFGSRRVAIIDDADHFNLHSANCLLKTLEEPPPQSLLILIGTSPSRQLPTIRSRSQLVRFGPLSVATLERLILASGHAQDASEAHRLAEHGEGSLENAVAMADPELWEFRQRLGEMFSAPQLDGLRIGRMILEFVESSGKEPGVRRQRLRTVVRFAVEHYRELLRITHSTGAADRLDLCLTALEHIDRNVNQATLVGWWMSELGAQPVASR
jgi:DNA polymerase III subunit delta'